MSRLSYGEQVAKLREMSRRYCWGFVFHQAGLYIPYANAGDLVLEVGCHKQLLKPHIEARGARYVGVDVCTYDGVKIDVVCDGHHLPFRDQVFNKVYAVHVMEHLEEPFRFLCECRRVLIHRGGRWGHLINQVPIEEMSDETHLYSFIPESIKRLTHRAGFNSILIDENGPTVMTVVAW